MTDKVIVSKSEIINAIQRAKKGNVFQTELYEWIDKATPVSGEAVKLRMVYPDFTLIGCAKCGSHDVGGHKSSVTCYKCGQTHKSDDKHNATIVWNNAQLYCLSSTPQPAIPEGYALVPIEPSEKWIQKTCLRKSNTKCSTYAEWEKSHEFLHSTTVAKFRELVIADYKSMVSEAIKGE